MRRTGPACLLLLAVALGGCGGSGGGGGEKSVTVKPGAPLPVTAKEYSFNPKGVEIDAGGRPVQLTIQLHNNGSITHDLKVEQGGSEIGGTNIIQGGQSASATVKLKPGSYTYFCSVGDHEQLGMKGSLTVK